MAKYNNDKGELIIEGCGIPGHDVEDSVPEEPVMEEPEDDADDNADLEPEEDPDDEGS